MSPAYVCQSCLSPNIVQNPAPISNIEEYELLASSLFQVQERNNVVFCQQCSHFLSKCRRFRACSLQAHQILNQLAKNEAKVTTELLRQAQLPVHRNTLRFAPKLISIQLEIIDIPPSETIKYIEVEVKQEPLNIKNESWDSLPNVQLFDNQDLSSDSDDNITLQNLAKKRRHYTEKLKHDAADIESCDRNEIDIAEVNVNPAAELNFRNFEVSLLKTDHNLNQQPTKDSIEANTRQLRESNVNQKGSDIESNLKSLFSSVFPCYHCNKKFASQKNLQQHIDTHKIVNCNFKCKKCDFNCNALAELKQHSQSHKTVVKSCKTKCKTVSTASENCIITGNEEKPKRTRRKKEKAVPTCTICQKVLANNQNVLRHMLIHTGERQYECSVCHSRFAQASTLRSHLLTHTNERPFQCTECNKRFSKRGNLKSHMRTHNLDMLPTHVCEICGKHFILNGNLKTHMLLHTGEKPYPCTVCDKRFRRSDYLSEHMTIHTLEKPFQCELCPKRFGRRVHWRKHMRVHSGERPHKCTICEKSYTQRAYLRDHMKTHTGEPSVARNKSAKNTEPI